MFDAYVIEVGDIAAGVIVKDGPRFTFCASDSNFSALDGRNFHNARDAEAAARRHIAGTRGRPARPPLAERMLGAR